MRKFSGWLLIALLVLAVSSSAATAVSEEPWKEFDFGGETIKIFSWWQDHTPLGARGAFNWYNPDARLQAHIEEVEQMFNVNIEFVLEESRFWMFPWGDPNLLLSSLLAGELPFHFTHLPGGQYVQQVSMGVLQPLDDVLEPDFYDSYPPLFQWDKEAFRVGANIYGFESTNYNREPIGIVWNLDMFEREGLPNLYDLYDSGDWTWEAFADIARRATKDTSGDGVIDQIGARVALGSYLDALVASYGGGWQEDIDGRLEFTVDQKYHAIEALEFGVRLLDEGVVTSTYSNERLSGDYAMGLWYVHMITEINNAGGDTYGIVPIPKGPNATEHVVGQWGHWIGAIPITVENPRAVIEVVKALQQLSYPYIDDLVEWEQNWLFNSPGIGLSAPDQRSLEIFKWMHDRTSQKDHISSVTSAAMAKAGWNWVEFVEAVADGQSPTAYIAERKPAIQAEIDLILGQ